jgi:hypothetical protein
MPTPRADRYKSGSSGNAGSGSSGSGGFAGSSVGGASRGAETGRNAPTPPPGRKLKPGEKTTLYTDSLLKKKNFGPGNDEYAEEQKKKKTPFFVSFAHSMGRTFSGFGRGATFSPDMADAISFLGWDVSAEEYYAAYKSIFLVGVVLGCSRTTTQRSP